MAERRPKVFVVNKSTHDYSQAEKYGELVYVTTGHQYHFATGTHARNWLEKLKNSQPEDMIILSSLNVLCGIGCAVFAMLHGRLNLLLYRNGKYMLREVRLDQLLEAEIGEWPIKTEEKRDDTAE